MKIEKKQVALEGAQMTEEGFLTGYASIKGSVDSYGDTIVDGAYVDVPDLIKNGFVTIGHKLGDLPVGYIVEACEDQRGLWVKMAFHTTTEAQETRKVVMERLAAGKSQGLSIDYYTLESQQGNGDARRVLQKIQVKGFAIVNLPAEAQATVLDAKDAGPGTPFVDQFKQVLESVQDWTKRAEDLHVLRKNGLSAFHRKRVSELKAALTVLEGGLTGPDEKSDRVSDDQFEAILELEDFYRSLDR